MAASAPITDDIVDKPMYDAARAGLAKCMWCQERLAVFDQLGLSRPEVKSLVEEWQPRFEATVEYYNQQRANRVGTDLTG